MNKNFGCQNMVSPIKRVLMKHPKDAYQNQNKVNEQSPQLHYFGIPDFEKTNSDYDNFLGLLESFDIEIHFLPNDDSTSLDSVYTHDPCVISNGGVILCTMGKNARVPESQAVESYFKSIGVPILGRIESPGTLEGGDVVWIDERTVAVGEGYRSNADGIRQFKTLLG
ncbi:MAG: amidinotransferase, partial [Candidatus Marinimicrobia bacterium]|nr:amidinotransferase [Candidatus Neomarinimicrobiota bacterium]